MHMCVYKVLVFRTKNLTYVDNLVGLLFILHPYLSTARSCINYYHDYSGGLNWATIALAHSGSRGSEVGLF